MAQVATQSSQSTSKMARPPFATSPSTIPLVNVCADIARRVDAFLGSALGSSSASDSPEIKEIHKHTIQKVKESLNVNSEALRRYTFDELAISFNGGKDCLVMLVLLLASLHYHASEYPPQRIHTVYVHSYNSFAEVDSFVNECTALYSLDLIRLPNPMKGAFEQFLKAKPHIKAIMVGTRRTDPNGAELTFFDETDHGWPKFMRVHPVIDWHYAEVWHFLRQVDVPYCVLYDMGYTSLGGTTDTHPNPALADAAGKSGSDFKPAYTLIDDDKERLGRNK
ncbi:hypothetical protein V1512DRAFT_260436 [Lipomyces arxii]|uniref:uncharacterized protein n=1 Tax=Lipomyces arxii TaxID=56418 RepID=UPI0034CD5FAC